MQKDLAMPILEYARAINEFHKTKVTKDSKINCCNLWAESLPNIFLDTIFLKFARSKKSQNVSKSIKLKHIFTWGIRTPVHVTYVSEIKLHLIPF